MSYQKTTGTLSPGAHPGSYNGQDAYSDMLVTDGNYNEPQRYAIKGGHERNRGFLGGFRPQGPADSNKTGGGR